MPPLGARTQVTGRGKYGTYLFRVPSGTLWSVETLPHWRATLCRAPSAFRRDHPDSANRRLKLWRSECSLYDSLYVYFSCEASLSSSPLECPCVRTSCVPCWNRACRPRSTDPFFFCESIRLVSATSPVRGARGRIEDWRVAKPWWRNAGWSAQGGLLSGVFRAAQRPTGASCGLAAAWSAVEMVRLQPAPEARAAPPYPRPAASGELPRMGKRRTVGRVSTGQFARSLRGARVHAE